MKKLTTILFILVGLVILFLIIQQNVDFSDSQSNTFANGLSSSNSATQSQNLQTDVIPENEDVTVLVPLFPDEVLVTAITIDFNMDNYVDQVIAVKNSSSPFIKVVIGLYNPLFGAYERAYELNTAIQQTATFSLDVLDITGTHENTLIISGYSTTNQAILKAWISNPNTSSLNLRLIADLSADGTIFITQNARSSSYAFSSEDGESFPIWIYTSDPESSQASLDQLHIMYDWNKETSIYEKVSQTRILGRNINAQELAKIQDGTEKTFGSFLSATWLHTASASQTTPVVSFDYTNKTINFLNEDTVEIYNWESSILRRNGILIYATNRNIPALLRRIDITLISIDEIRIKATDTLTLRATPNTTWDGNYKKQQVDSVSVINTTKTENVESSLIEALKTTSSKLWEDDNGYTITFSSTSYAAQKDAEQIKGAYTPFSVYNEELIQFKSLDSSGFFNGFYRIQIVEATEDSPKLAVFLPVEISSTHIVQSISQGITLRQITR